MAVITPSDQEARARIQRDLDATLFVEAGAGTGKTRELIERVLGLVTSGNAGLRQVAAITFTEAAAAELRDRIRLRLEAAEADVGTFSDEERGRCSQALGELDAAAIETLHGFAQRILTEHPLEAGLPPLIEVRDEIAASVDFDEHWAAFLDQLLDDPALGDTLLRAFTMGLELDHLREIAIAFHGSWDRLEDISIAGEPQVSLDVSAFAAELSDICGLHEHCTAPDDLLLKHLMSLEAYGERLARAGSDFDQLRVLAEPRGIRSNYGQKGNWHGVAVADVRDRLQAAEDQRDSMLAATGASVLPALIRAVRQFVLDYADERRRLGRLEFHDLLVQARDLLRNDADVRASVRSQFSHLLIDEFQDTDPLQIEIAVLLATPDQPSVPTSWRDIEIEEGRLFFVGDPKQSIYRFRRADIGLYQSVQQRFASGVVRLQQNFRSVSPVIDWVNAMFTDLMGNASSNGQAAYYELDASREALEADPSVQLLGRPGAAPMNIVRSAEAKEVARAIHAAKRDAWQVSDETDGTSTRAAKYADMAILIPSRTALPTIEDALEAAGVPYRVEARSLIYGTQEVRDLLSILRSIDDPTDEVALIAALRSPAFACGDDDLLRFRNARGRWDYRRDPPTELSADDPVVAATRALHNLHQRRWWAPINTIVEAVIRERWFFELAFAHRRPRERWQRLRLVLDQARAFAEAGGHTLRQFIDWAERQADEGTRLVETVVPEPDDDAVRIMTIHAAKGLEFPIVLLAGLNVERSSQHRPDAVLWDGDRGIEVAMGGRKHLRTSGYEERAEHEKRMDEQEKVRLLYVAATRARDHLIVSLHHKENNDPTKSLAGRLYPLCAPTPDLWREPPPMPHSVQPAAGAFDDSSDRFHAWRDRRQTDIETLRRVPTKSATEIAHEAPGAGDDPNVQKEPPVEEVPPWRRGRAGTALGRAVHAVLQSIDLKTRAELDSAARAQATAEGITDRWEEVARMVAAALDSITLREALASDRFWRELYVSAPIGEVSIEGFVDLLYETADGLVVVDYKTDRVPGDAELAAAMERYTPQGAAYALAIETALGRRVARCVFVFARAGGADEREIDDLEAAVADLRALLGAAPSPIAPPSRE